MQLCVWLHCIRVKQISFFFYWCVWADIGKFDGHFTHLLFVGLWKDETPVRWEVGWMSINFLVFLFKALSLWKEGTDYFTTFPEIILNGVKSAVFTSRFDTVRENIERWPLSNSRLTTKIWSWGLCVTPVIFLPLKNLSVCVCVCIRAIKQC